MTDQPNSAVPVSGEEPTAVTAGVALTYTPGNAAGFIQALWQQLPAYPDGVLVGALHLVGDRGQVQVQLSDLRLRQIEVLPGQALQVEDAADRIPGPSGTTPHRPTMTTVLIVQDNQHGEGSLTALLQE